MAGTTFNIPDAIGDPKPVTTNPNGRFGEADSKSITLATQDKTVFDAINTNTGATANALTDVTDVNSSLKIAFYYNGVAVDPTAAGAVIGGTVAGAALAFAPVTTGGLAKTANPAAVDDGDVVNALFDKTGKQIAVSALREAKVLPAPVTFTSTSEASIVAAGGASIYNDLYRLIITNTSATAVNVTIRDDTAGTIRYVFAVGAGQTTGFSCDAGSAAKQSVANKPWTAQLSSGVTSVIITAEAVANL